ncbi:MAG: hypothetical protein CM1200mP20_06040 [Pseudomonadota bacterium]|nr:MAG: hypothetical protein CM1200mP20_06040 [Pseudomonadota bacterium]
MMGGLTDPPRGDPSTARKFLKTPCFLIMGMVKHPFRRCSRDGSLIMPNTRWQQSPHEPLRREFEQSMPWIF